MLPTFARVVSVLGVVYKTPHNRASRDYVKTRHPRQFPKNCKFKGSVLCRILL